MKITEYGKVQLMEGIIYLHLSQSFVRMMILFSLAVLETTRNRGVPYREHSMPCVHI
jgi:hypothetical protein